MTDDSILLPLFPLTGSLLLPGNYLPLNVFEPRYRRLVEDALDDSGLIGMIQPRVPALDAFGPLPGETLSQPELYRVGCAGRIEQAERQSDGRYLIVLKGERRFKSERELPLHRGYRRVLADVAAYADDLLEPSTDLEPEALLAAAIAYAEKHDLEFDQDLLQALEPHRLLHALCAALPFEPGEKQALLEAETVTERQKKLLALMDMGRRQAPLQSPSAPPLVN